MDGASSSGLGSAEVMKSNDERFLSELALALQTVGLEAIVVGNMASILNGAPVLTQDVDLLVRDTPLNRKKLKRLAAALGGTGPLPISDLTNTARIYGADIPVDIIYDRLSGNLNFASIKSRARLEPVGAATLLVAGLADVIKSKAAAGRRKDKATLPILRDTLRTRQAAGLEAFRADVRKAVTEHVVSRPRKRRRRL